MEMIQTAFYPVQMAAEKGIQLYRRKKQRDRMSQKKRSSRVHSDTEHAQVSNKMRRKAAGKKETGRKGQKKSRQSGSGVHSFVKSQMLNSFLDKFSTEKEFSQDGLIEGTTKTAKAAVLMAVQMIMTALAPVLLGLFAVVGIIGVIVVAVIAVIYNSPLSIFFPQSDTGYDSPRTVLCEYYKEFNDQIMKLEKDDYVITYQNTEDGAPVSNFNDTLMVYMVKYGTGQAGFVMDEEGKKNLDKVFDEMNYYDSSSSTAQIPAGASLGEVVTTGYCSCSICCGQWAGGHTASGTVPKGNHTLAVDAHSPKVPMGTKIVMNGHTYKVEDTGNFARYGTDFDIYFDTHAEAQAWGKRKVKAYLADGDENKWLSGIGAGPIEGYTKKTGSNEYEWSNIFNDGYVQQYFGPDSLMEYDTVNDITDSQDTSGEEIAQEENESGITIEEAGNMIDSFLKETGFSSIPQTESSQLKWSGYNERADHVYQEDDIHECVSGYRFYYNIGVGKILFDDALNPMDYSGYNMKYGDSIEDTFDNEFYNFYVDKYGICTFYIDCPVSIVRKQENVEMLPLENIFDIARDELKNNAEEYVLDTNVKYYTLKLAYIRVNNRTDMQKYSYIPAWSLELLQKDTTNACPVFINAIDGSVIHPDDLS